MSHSGLCSRASVSWLIFKVLFSYWATRAPAIKEKVQHHSKGGEPLAQVAIKGSGCSIPEDIQSQDGQNSEQPDLVVGIPVHCKGSLTNNTVILLATKRLLPYIYQTGTNFSRLRS